VYNPQDIAVELRWNDMRAETTGHNAPDLVAPPWDQQRLMAPDFAVAPDEAGGEDSGDFWGVEEQDTGGGDDFWGEGGGEEAAAGPDTEFSDAVAIQLPQSLPTGIRKPYFIFGDAQSPVDLWFVDLARKRVETHVGRGSASVVATPGDDIEVVASFDRGQWRVVYKRSLRSTSGITFGPEQFVPVAFSVWDGFHSERGNKRALSRWLYLYLEPSEDVAVAGPMLEAALVALVIELLIVFLVRRWYSRKRTAEQPGPTGAMSHGGVAR